MIRIAICDDELQELSRITKLISRYYDQKKAAYRYDAFSSATELLETMKKCAYDILLLDVLMPGINGIQAAHEIRGYDQDIKIIFLTSSPEYAVESYAVDAYYYFMKPATEAKLFPILDKIYLEALSSEEGLSIKSAAGIMRISFHKLEFLEVMNKKLFFHLSDGKVKEVPGALSSIEEKLLSRKEFIKVHRSYIVNMGYIEELRNGTILTSSGHNIPISRLITVQVRESYMKYLFIEKGVE